MTNWAAGFGLEQAVTMDALRQAEDPLSLLLPVDSYFARHPALTVSGEVEKKIRNGMTVVLPQTEDGTYRVYGEGGFLAVSQAKRGKLSTIKSFFEV